MYKKLRKICAWALAVVTVLTIVPSSGMVMADTEPANAKEVEQGSICERMGAGASYLFCFKNKQAD